MTFVVLGRKVRVTFNRPNATDVIDVDSQAVLARRYEPVTEAVLQQMSAAGFGKVDVVDVSWDDGILVKTLRQLEALGTNMKKHPKAIVILRKLMAKVSPQVAQAIEDFCLAEEAAITARAAL